MALPLAPIAVAALKYGSVAAAAYGLARQIGPGRRDQAGEDALDRVPEGLTAHRPTDRADQGNATARFRRVIRLGANGPGIEIDAATIARIRFRKV